MEPLCDYFIKLSNISNSNPIYYLQNRDEGLCELASYLSNLNNLEICKRFFSENQMEVAEFSDYAYISIGSSSTQGFFPVKLNKTEILSGPILDLFTLENITIKGEDWTVLLIPNNVYEGIYLPLHILHAIYRGFPELKMALSNAFAHSCYGKDCTYKGKTGDYEGPYTLFTTQGSRIHKLCVTLQQILNTDIVIRGFGSIPANTYNDGFSQNVIVVPRISVDLLQQDGTRILEKINCTIENGWDTQISKSENIVDIGGGVTNNGFNEKNAIITFNDITKKKKEQRQRPVLTGNIREFAEKIFSGSISCSSLIPNLIPFELKDPDNPTTSDLFNDRYIKLIQFTPSSTEGSNSGGRILKKKSKKTKKRKSRKSRKSKKSRKRKSRR